MAMIVLSLDSGSSQAGKRFSPLYRGLNAILASRCSAPYSSSTELFAFLLCVSGEIADFGFEGYERLRRWKKDNSITLDIGIPEAHWKEVSDQDLRAYLMGRVEEALDLVVQKLEQAGEAVRVEELRQDIARVRGEFLGDDSTA